jgi:glycolate oxidase iron-sulfur subunit
VTNSPQSLTSAKYRAQLDQCIHCGLCLPACPTYDVFKSEMESPRGRISLMKAASDGRIDLNNEAFHTHIDLCLGCRACETACPSGVEYGSLLETTRQAMHEQTPALSPTEKAQAVALSELLPQQQHLRLGARLLQLYQATGAQRLARQLGLIPQALRKLDGLLPTISTRYPDYDAVAPANGKRRGAVAFLHGCVQDAFLTEVNAATIRVLQRNGFDVHFPAGQTCCGAAAQHVGEGDLARNLARRNIDVCTTVRYDAVISNAGGCGAALKEYAHWLADDAAYAERAALFAGQVQDVHEFLATNLHEPPRGALHLRVTYADSCHLRHGQQIVNQPRELLRTIPGLTLVEMSHPDFCCGSAGIYNIVQPETAEEILARKMADIRTTGADVIAVSNTGCHMQYLHGVMRHQMPMRVLHVMELLDLAYQRAMPNH